MHQITIYLLWAIWVVSWVAASGWSSRTKHHAPWGRELLSRVFTAIGAILLFGLYAPPYFSTLGWWHVDDTLGWVMAALTACGFAFAWWARIHLGELWSGTIVVKDGHRVIDTGPYRIVRHPIYTGIILATFATAVDRGTIVAVAGAAAMLAGWYIRARHEERFLRRELGADAYDAYAKKTAMLVPFVKL